ncbi:hypothetical protein ACQ9QD_10970 [Bacillus paralicheniformis]
MGFQQVVAKTGVASLANVQVPNPVVLAPSYRTFAQVEQARVRIYIQNEEWSNLCTFRG